MCIHWIYVYVHRNIIIRHPLVLSNSLINTTPPLRTPQNRGALPLAVGLRQGFRGAGRGGRTPFQRYMHNFCLCHVRTGGGKRKHRRRISCRLPNQNVIHTRTSNDRHQSSPPQPNAINQKAGAEEAAGPREVDTDLFLSCFSEEIRPALRYLLCARTWICYLWVLFIRVCGCWLVGGLGLIFDLKREKRQNHQQQQQQ